VRPYLVAKKTGLPLSSQMAVYIVERLFDAGSMALIFSWPCCDSPEEHCRIRRSSVRWAYGVSRAQPEERFFW
jgi:hypothetical protein